MSKRIDFGFEQTIVKYCTCRKEVVAYEAELQESWEVVVPDLSLWPILHDRYSGVFGWSVKRKKAKAHFETKVMEGV